MCVWGCGGGMWGGVVVGEGVVVGVAVAVGVRVVAAVAVEDTWLVVGGGRQVGAGGPGGWVGWPGGGACGDRVVPLTGRRSG